MPGMHHVIHATLNHACHLDPLLPLLVTGLAWLRAGILPLTCPCGIPALVLSAMSGGTEFADLVLPDDDAGHSFLLSSSLALTTPPPKPVPREDPVSGIKKSLTFSATEQPGCLDFLLHTQLEVETFVRPHGNCCCTLSGVVGRTAVDSLQRASSWTSCCNSFRRCPTRRRMTKFFRS